MGAEIYATVGTAEEKQFLIRLVGVKPGNSVEGYKWT